MLSTHDMTFESTSTIESSFAAIVTFSTYTTYDVRVVVTVPYSVAVSVAYEIASRLPSRTWYDPDTSSITKPFVLAPAAPTATFVSTNALFVATKMSVEST